MRRQVLYSGRVQGVGFRATVQFLAREFAVTGWVKNLPDGRVEMIVEGMAEEMDRFMGAIAKQMGRNIREVAVTESEATGEFSGFYIAR